MNFCWFVDGLTGAIDAEAIYLYVFIVYIFTFCIYLLASGCDFAALKSTL